MHSLTVYSNYLDKFEPWTIYNPYENNIDNGLNWT